MLEELQIRNWALIEKLTVRFGAGFNVLTGETGAGKSILIGAFSLLLGERANIESIRTGADECMTTGIFVLTPDSEGRRWLQSRDIETEEGVVIVRRIIKRGGRGSIFVQSTPITRADLKAFTATLVDLHGQHQHQSLLQEEQHRLLLDRQAGLEEEAIRFQRAFRDLNTRKQRFQKLLSGERERLREMDLLRFATQEIEEARLHPGEQERLESEIGIMEQHEQLYEKLQIIHDALAEHRAGAVALLRNARQALENAVSIDVGLSDIARRLNDLFYELEDIDETIRDRIGGVQFSQDRLDECHSRLSLIRRLEKRYGNSIPEMLEYCREAIEQLHGFETWEEDKADLQREIQASESQVMEQALRLSELRRAAAREMGARVEEVLQTLGMKQARFEIAIERNESAIGEPICGPHGVDAISFHIAPNPGEPLKSLREIASGGEISRVMLAIKTVLTDSDPIESMIFDEIDVGIGGEVALAVGDHLQRLADRKQLLCITHLASIAARADNHIVVEKSIKEDRTVTGATGLDARGRVEEIARMLAGDRRGDVSQTHAEELLQRYARRG